MSRVCKLAGETCVYPCCACYPKDDESLHAANGLPRIDGLAPPPPPMRAPRVDTSNPMHHFADPRPPLQPQPVRYVCGFAMSPSNVLLLTKAKPAWQAGLLNGVGGKVEQSDPTLREAMAREFLEETRVHVADFLWTLFHTECFKDADGPVNAEVYFFYARVTADIMKEACEHTANGVEPCSVHVWRDIGEDRTPHIGNLPYLLRMASLHWHNLLEDAAYKNPLPFVAAGMRV